MKIVNVDDVKDILKLAIPIGFGATAICYLLPNGKVAKIFYKDYITRVMCKKSIEELKLLSSISNESFVAPETYIMKENQCIGYLCPYVRARTLHSINRNTTINELISAYKVLLDDVKKISSKGFMLVDVHDKNILYNGTFKMIDLDGGSSYYTINEDKLINRNTRLINRTIVEAIFKLSYNQNVVFSNEDLDELYDISVYKDSNYFEDFLNNLCSLAGGNKIKILRKKISYHKD